jgi:hypothetical protein
MRRTLGPLLLLPLLLGALTGCGDDDESANDGPTPSESSNTAAPSPDPAAEPVVVAVVSETNAGGTVSDVLSPVDGAALDDFLTRLDSGSLGDKVRGEVESYDAPEGHSLGAAVVAVACDVPPGVSVTEAGDGWAVSPHKVPSPLPECFAPVTTVVVVDVPGEVPPGPVPPGS